MLNGARPVSINSSDDSLPQTESSRFEVIPRALDGDGYIPDVDFDDAVGGTVGVGWRWVGLTYTDIHYNSAATGRIDGSNVGISFTWKF